MGWFFSAKCNSPNRVDGKTVIITGCNTGIGKETALELYKRGGNVIMACRDVKKAETAAGDVKKCCEGVENVGNVSVKELDLSSFESIRKFVADILETTPEIHVLINNAGIMCVPKQLSKDGYELQFAVNHLGHFLLTLLLLPRILKSRPARIITVSSSAHEFGDGKWHFDDVNLDKSSYSPLGAYGRSKLANILFSSELGRRLKGTGVNTYSLHPGVIATELGRSFPDSYPFIWWPMVDFLAKLFIKTTKQGAQTTLYCALDDKCADETGLYYKECAVAQPRQRALDVEKGKELWEESLKLVNLENYDPFAPET